MGETEFTTKMLEAFLRWLFHAVQSGRRWQGWDDPANIHFLPCCFFSHDEQYRQQIDFVGRVECLEGRAEPRARL